MRLLGRLVELQNGYSGYDENGHLQRPIGKITLVLDRDKELVVVSWKDGSVSEEIIGKTILFT